MIHSDNGSRMEFNFEGQFLDFVKHDGKLKYLRLKVLSEEIQIKIPKTMRITVGLTLQPGEPIWVKGIGKLDQDAHELKLKATQIIPLTERASTVPTSATRSLRMHQPKSQIKPKIKVLVCKKSGCLKRGGKGLCEALDQTLCDHRLEEHVTIERTGCLKRCSSAPNLVIMPGNQRYTEVRPKILPQIAEAIAQSLIRH